MLAHLNGSACWRPWAHADNNRVIASINQSSHRERTACTGRKPGRCRPRTTDDLFGSSGISACCNPSGVDAFLAYSFESCSYRGAAGIPLALRQGRSDRRQNLCSEQQNNTAASNASERPIGTVQGDEVRTVEGSASCQLALTPAAARRARSASTAGFPVVRSVSP